MSHPFYGRDMTLFAGFATSLSLIAAIGAQNAFVLRQGLRREHVLTVVLTCAVADVLLIFGGIAGLGALFTRSDTALAVARYGGAAFLLAYALIAARRALRPSAMPTVDHAPVALRRVMLTCLGFTYLNPHVYLDTVVLLGALANQHGTQGRWLYGAGAIIASFGWFFALGFLAHHLGPVFTRPRAWQFLDGGIALTMTALGVWMLL